MIYDDEKYGKNDIWLGGIFGDNFIVFFKEKSYS